MAQNPKLPYVSTVGELVEKLGGRLAQGDASRPIAGVNAVERASSMELVFAEDAATAARAIASQAGAVVVKSGMGASWFPTHGSDEAAAVDGAPAVLRHKAIIEAEQPRLWFARAGQVLRLPRRNVGVHPAAIVADDAVLREGVAIGAGAVIEACATIGAGSTVEAGAVVGRWVRVGKDCHIYPRAVLYPGTTLGDRVIVHAGAVLGADGFGYVRDAKTGAYTQFPQQGTLEIEDDVEIGANSTIDRGALSETRVRRGTKIDNLVHVGHNCDIGEDVILVTGTGISGSCTVGKGAVIAGQVGIGDHAHIGPGVILGGQAGVLSGKTVTNEGLGVKPGTVLWGTPARPLAQVLREIAIVSRMAKRAAKISKEVKE